LVSQIPSALASFQPVTVYTYNLLRFVSKTTKPAVGLAISVRCNVVSRGKSSPLVNDLTSSTADAAGLIGPKGVPMEGGDVKFVDMSGPAGIKDNVINEYDKTIIGNPNPDLFGGIFTTLSFKNFELSAIFNYSVGNDVFNYLKYQTESMDSYNNQSSSILGRWKNDGDITDMPRASFGDPTGNTVFSDRWIEDGSYLRLEQLSLSYVLPAVSGIYKGITLYVTGSNLLTFTKYTGYDPDMMYANSPFYMGVDYGKMPQTRSFIVGLKLDL